MNKETQSTERTAQEKAAEEAMIAHKFDFGYATTCWYFGIDMFNAGVEFAAHQFKRSPSDAQKGEETALNLVFTKDRLPTINQAYFVAWWDYDTMQGLGVSEFDGKKFRMGRREAQPDVWIEVSKEFLSTHKEEPQGMKWVRAEELLKEYEKREADIIGNDKCWQPEGMANTPRLTEQQWQKLIELQTKRNELLSSDAGQSSNVKEI